MLSNAATHEETEHALQEQDGEGILAPPARRGIVERYHAGSGTGDPRIVSHASLIIGSTCSANHSADAGSHVRRSQVILQPDMQLRRMRLAACGSANPINRVKARCRGRIVLVVSQPLHAAG